MFDVSIQSSGGLEIIASLEAMTKRLEDMSSLGETIKQLMYSDVQEARAAGEDQYGNRLAELAPSTLKDKRRTGGPPMAPYGNPPKYGLGRLSQGFHVDVNSSPGRVHVIGTWPLAPWLKYHGQGPDHSRYLPVRQITGMRPVGYELARQAVLDYLETPI